MKKQICMAIVATLLFSSSAFAQAFQAITPSSLGVANGALVVNQSFDLGAINSSVFGVDPGEVIVTVTNGQATAGGGSWTVGEGFNTNFAWSGSSSVEAFVNHGGVLGSQTAPGATGVTDPPQDGIIASAGETFSFTSPIFDSSEYLAQNIGNQYFVAYTGPDDGVLHSNDSADGTVGGFRWESDQAVSSYLVNSNNTSFADRNDNFGTGFRVVASAVPEPSSAMLIALGGLFVLRRKRNA